MKNKITLLVVLQLFLMLGACSSDSGSDSAVEPIVVKTPKITSFSKNSGETGETITLNGENLSDKISEIKITFDEVSATIVSATTKEITFVLPKSGKVLPKFALTIADKKVKNEVKNDYEGAIGILPKPSTSDWFTMENTLKIDARIFKMQMQSDKILYYSMHDTRGVYRTLDGGITYKYWGNSGLSGAFYATSNDEGWAVPNGGGIEKVPVGGGEKYRPKRIESAPTFGINAIIIDENLLKGTVISSKGKVFTTDNGADFTEVYAGGDYFISQSAHIDNDHIWCAGVIQIETGSNTRKDHAVILFNNKITNTWLDYIFDKEDQAFRANEICFVDELIGFVLLRNYETSDTKIFKTTNGGYTWKEVFNAEKFTKFAFKDTNTGWAIAENKIYKTVDGAATWTLDYNHDQPIKAISYKNNVVWAISTDKIIKRYLK